VKFAYADPSYPGHTKRGLYKHDPRAAVETDHRELVDRLCGEYPDGWALSTGSNNLHAVLPLCPPDVRVGAWVKPFCSFKPNVNPAYAWEPVIFRGGRKRERFEPTVRDWVVANATIKKGLAGAKPEEFCAWLFQVLNAHPGDILDDLYPGTRGVSLAWEQLMGAA
jgi:hypothetical protein